jgi:2-keto-4-pentenoate hydratase/2-oxohepta-3-ene-1,7-dioic acid hydratase in catechol pathway
MLLFRNGPEGIFAVYDPETRISRVLASDPFATLPDAWELGAEIEKHKVSLLPPVRPGKIVGVGRNYAEHARELGNEVPEEPLLFLKAPSSVIGAHATIVLPPESQRVEHEGEIAVVMRRRLSRGATVEEARQAVLGIACANDVTARDLQRKDKTFARGKSFDTFCPLGPSILLGAALENLEVITRVNGKERQRGHTRNMEFPIVDLLVYIARMMTLEPGDVVLTGTPSGVGPLEDGDSVEVEIPDLGVLVNPVEKWSPS